MGNGKKKANNVYIEISGSCPGKCPYCAQWRLKSTKKFGKLMPHALFTQILDHLLSIEVIDPSITSIINLINWGEPFVNIEINQILKSLEDKGLSAGLSSNFIVKPNIEKELLSAISGLTLSLSGFSQETYGKIHGAQLEKVLNNFEWLYERFRKYSPETKISVSWHRYLFNEHELWKAYKYFKRPGINFVPEIAYYDDAQEMINFLRGKLSEDRMLQGRNDLFLNYLHKLIDRHRRQTKNYYCQQWDRIVIDERGQLLLCCGVTGYDSKHVLGKVLEMSAKDIWKGKSSDPFCKRCISTGFARFGNTIRSYWFLGKPLPPGGGIHCFRLCTERNLDRHKLIQSLWELPKGDKIVPLLLKIKRKIMLRNV